MTTLRFTSAISLALLAVTSAADAQPPAMAPGGPSQCVGRVLLPGHDVVETKRVLQSPARLDRHMIPPVVEHSFRSELVRPARVERKVVPAAYRIETRTFQVPGPIRWEHTDAQYTTQTEHVLVSAGHYVWEKHYGPMASAPPQPGQTIVEPTGEIMCKVWCPARYEDVQRQVLVAPARRWAVKTMTTRTVSHKVLVHPALTMERTVPAQYRQIPVSRIVRPGRVEVVHIAAVYGEVQTHRIVGGGAGWSPVVCGGPLSREAMQRMQQSLAQKGYDPGPQDGEARPQTYEALRKFQMDNRMAAGQITVESARALNVIP
jgi:hypothetical protein